MRRGRNRGARRNASDSSSCNGIGLTATEAIHTDPLTRQLMLMLLAVETKAKVSMPEERGGDSVNREWIRRDFFSFVFLSRVCLCVCLVAGRGWSRSVYFCCRVRSFFFSLCVEYYYTIPWLWLSDSPRFPRMDTITMQSCLVSSLLVCSPL